MKTNKIIFIQILLFGLSMFIQPALFAAEDSSSIKKTLLDDLRVEKKALLALGLELNADEAEVFWPLYEKYESKLIEVFKRQQDLIDEYLESDGVIAESRAKKMLDEHMTIMSERLKIRKRYFKKFRSILPAEKVFLLYQLENKIQAGFDYGLAVAIPLINSVK